MAKNKKTTIKYSDSIHTKNLGLIRLTEVDPETELFIGNHWVIAGDIPLNAGLLKCGHHIRGIALQEKDIIFCETCHEESYVVTANS